MMQFMEEQGQYYNQCVTEMKEFVRVYTSLENMMGPMCLLTMNNDSVSKIMNRFDGIGYEYNGKTVSTLICKN